MTSRKQPPPPSEQYPFSGSPPSPPPSPLAAPSGDNPLPGVTFDSAIALSQVGTELGRIANQLGGLDHLERIGDALDNHRVASADLARIRTALEAIVLLMASASAGPAPTLRDAAVKASNRIASLHP